MSCDDYIEDDRSSARGPLGTLIVLLGHLHAAELPQNSSRRRRRGPKSATWLTPNAVSFVAERRKPSGIALRNTNDSPGGLRRSATIHPLIGSKVDGTWR